MKKKKKHWKTVKNRKDSALKTSKWNKIISACFIFQFSFCFQCHNLKPLSWLHRFPLNLNYSNLKNLFPSTHTVIFVHHVFLCNPVQHFPSKRKLFFVFWQIMPTIQMSAPNSSGLIRLWSTGKNVSALWIMDMDWTMIQCIRCSGIEAAARRNMNMLLRMCNLLMSPAWNLKEKHHDSFTK